MPCVKAFNRRQTGQTTYADLRRLHVAWRQQSPTRVVCTLDCDIAVNSNVIRAQIEGCIGYGLSAVLGEEITLGKGKIVQSNFNNHSLLRIKAMLQVEVHRAASAETPFRQRQTGCSFPLPPGTTI